MAKTHTEGVSSDPGLEFPPPERQKDPAAVVLGRKGGLKGGKARVAKMTKEELSESARNAANARWQKRKGPTPGN